MDAETASRFTQQFTFSLTPSNSKASPSSMPRWTIDDLNNDDDDAQSSSSSGSRAHEKDPFILKIREGHRYGDEDVEDASIDPDADDLFDMLPNELVNHIFSHLERKDLYKMMRLSHRMYRLATDPHLRPWKFVDLSGIRMPFPKNRLLKYVSARCPNLLELKLNSCELTPVTDDSLIIAAETNLPQSSPFAIQFASSVAELCVFCSRLEYLDLSDIALGSSATQIIAKCLPVTLKYLYLTNCALGGVGVNDTGINIGSANGEDVNSLIIRLLKRLPQLEELNLAQNAPLFLDQFQNPLKMLRKEGSRPYLRINLDNRMRLPRTAKVTCELCNTSLYKEPLTQYVIGVRTQNHITFELYVDKHPENSVAVFTPGRGMWNCPNRCHSARFLFLVAKRESIINCRGFESAIACGRELARFSECPVIALNSKKRKSNEEK